MWQNSKFRSNKRFRVRVESSLISVDGFDVLLPWVSPKVVRVAPDEVVEDSVVDSGCPVEADFVSILVFLGQRLVPH
jgi:hypothetical protein